MVKKFAKRQTTDSDLNQVQDNLVKALNPVFNSSILDGVLLKSITLISGSNTINNPLLRTVQGIIPVNKSTFVDVYLTSNQIKTLTLDSSAAATCDFWIF